MARPAELAPQRNRGAAIADAAVFMAPSQRGRAVGFVLLSGWAITGVYFAFPEPFEWFFNTFDNNPENFQRPGEEILLLLIQWHFGRFGGVGIRILWVILGLLPVVLYVTGFTVWWKRIRSSPSTRAR